MEKDTSTAKSDDVLSYVMPHLTTSQHDSRKIVLMLCGISGAGKSTLAKAVINALPSYERLSIDSIIAKHHGLYGIDYPPSKYGEYQNEADGIYRDSFDAFLHDDHSNIVLDRSFYAKEDRNEFSEAIEQSGARKVLVYLRGTREQLWKRICARREKGVNADAALAIDEELLDNYLEGFEEPSGEGEIIIDIS